MMRPENPTTKINRYKQSAKMHETKLKKVPKRGRTNGKETQGEPSTKKRKISSAIKTPSTTEPSKPSVTLLGLPDELLLIIMKCSGWLELKRLRMVPNKRISGIAHSIPRWTSYNSVSDICETEQHILFCLRNPSVWRQIKEMDIHWVPGLNHIAEWGDNGREEFKELAVWFQQVTPGSRALMFYARNISSYAYAWLAVIYLLKATEVDTLRLEAPFVIPFRLGKAMENLIPWPTLGGRGDFPLRKLKHLEIYCGFHVNTFLEWRQLSTYFRLPSLETITIRRARFWSDPEIVPRWPQRWSPVTEISIEGDWSDGAHPDYFHNMMRACKNLRKLTLSGGCYCPRRTRTRNLYSDCPCWKISINLWRTGIQLCADLHADNLEELNLVSPRWDDVQDHEVVESKRNDFSTELSEFKALRRFKATKALAKVEFPPSCLGKDGIHLV